MIRLVVADDHEILRTGLCRILGHEEDIEVAADTGSGCEAVTLCTRLKPDVLLLDLEMPDMDGFEVTRHVKDMVPEVEILMLTLYGHEEYAVRILEAGGSGFAVKGLSHKELPDAIRKVAGGGKYVSPSVMNNAFAPPQQAGQEDPLSLLSETDFQVFIRMVRSDELNKITDDLCLSESIVQACQNHIMDVLDCKNKTDLIRFAIRIGLFSKT